MGVSLISARFRAATYGHFRQQLRGKRAADSYVFQSATYVAADTYLQEVPGLYDVQRPDIVGYRFIGLLR